MATAATNFTPFSTANVLPPYYLLVRPATDRTYFLELSKITLRPMGVFFGIYGPETLQKHLLKTSCVRRQGARHFLILVRLVALYAMGRIVVCVCDAWDGTVQCCRGRGG